MEESKIFDKLKEIETLVELSIGTAITEEKAAEIYSVTNELMGKVKNFNNKQNHKFDTYDVSDLKSLINQYFEENLIGKFSDNDSEFVKEIIRDFVENYY